MPFEKLQKYIYLSKLALTCLNSKKQKPKRLFLVSNFK